MLPIPRPAGVTETGRFQPMLLKTPIRVFPPGGLVPGHGQEPGKHMSGDGPAAAAGKVSARITLHGWR